MSTRAEARPQEIQRHKELHTADAVRLAWEWLRPKLAALLGVAAVLAFWQWQQTSVKVIPSAFIPPPLGIGRALVENSLSGEIPRELWWSYGNYFGGFGLAIVTAIPLGLLLGSSRVFYRLLAPYVWVFWMTPRIAFLPLIIVMMGYGRTSKIFIIFWSAFFFLMLQAMAGVQTVDHSLIKAAKSFGANRFHIFTKVVMPFTLPFIMTGLRLAASRAMVGVYASEIFGSQSGIGKYILVKTRVFHTEEAFAGLIILMLSSLAVVGLFLALERWAMPWRQEVKV